MATDPHDDPNVYLAAERTFLAWIRTGLALIGFGFVVARFGLFLREFSNQDRGHKFASTGFSLAVGVGLVLLGVLVDIGSTVHHVRLMRQLSRGQYLSGRPSFFAATIAIFLALVGLAMAVYLVIVRYSCADPVLQLVRDCECRVDIEAFARGVAHLRRRDR
jgi:putative membrane protein